jgi:hypothetical protein
MRGFVRCWEEAAAAMADPANCGIGHRLRQDSSLLLLSVLHRAEEVAGSKMLLVEGPSRRGQRIASISSWEDERCLE